MVTLHPICVCVQYLNTNCSKQPANACMSHRNSMPERMLNMSVTRSQDSVHADPWRGDRRE